MAELSRLVGAVVALLHADAAAAAAIAVCTARSRAEQEVSAAAERALVFAAARCALGAGAALAAATAAQCAAQTASEAAATRGHETEAARQLSVAQLAERRADAHAKCLRASDVRQKHEAAQLALASFVRDREAAQRATAAALRDIEASDAALARIESATMQTRSEIGAIELRRHASAAEANERARRSAAAGSAATFARLSSASAQRVPGGSVAQAVALAAAAQLPYAHPAHYQTQQQPVLQHRQPQTYVAPQEPFYANAGSRGLNIVQPPHGR
jgi:hypothetical protein